MNNNQNQSGISLDSLLQKKQEEIASSQPQPQTQYQAQAQPQYQQQFQGQNQSQGQGQMQWQANNQGQNFPMNDMNASSSFSSQNMGGNGSGNMNGNMSGSGISLDTLLQKNNQANQNQGQGSSSSLPNPYGNGGPNSIVLQASEKPAFTQEDLRQIEEIRNHIDLTSPNDVLSYGSAVQRNLSNFSDSVLEKVKLKDSGELVGHLLTELSTNVKDFDEKGQGKKGFLQRIFGKASRSLDDWRSRSDDVKVRVEKISAGLESAKVQMMKDIVIYDNLYQENLNFFNALTLYIEAGEQKLKEAQEVILPNLRMQASQSTDPMAVQVVNDFEQRVHRFEKRIHDLKISKTIAIQTAPQIRLIQNNDQVLVERVNSAINNTIPLWKNQIVIAIGLSNQQRVLELNKNISDTTNELLRRNAEALRINSIETAKENERSIVDIETVKKVNEELITTIEETLKIQKEGRTKRLQAEKELVQIEGRLKNALLENMQGKQGTQGTLNSYGRMEQNITPGQNGY